MAIDPAENVRLKGLLAQRDQLEPHADQAGALGFELSKLLDAQHHHLHDPGHEHTVARLKALGRTRQEVWDELEPLWQRVKVVEPVVSLLEHHTAELECVDRDRSDVADVARRTASLVEGLGSALAAIGFEVSIPDPPTPSWDSIEVVAARLGELRDVLTEERDDLQSRHAEANERHSELTAQIMAITG